MAADKEAAMSVLNISQIMEILPHRQPMLLIDSVEEIEYGVRAVAKKCVSFNEPFFAGHFPEEPVMPGVLIVEALAQAGAVAILGKDENRGKTAYFAFAGATSKSILPRLTSARTMVIIIVSPRLQFLPETGSDRRMPSVSMVPEGVRLEAGTKPSTPFSSSMNRPRWVTPEMRPS